MSKQATQNVKNDGALLLQEETMETPIYHEIDLDADTWLDRTEDLNVLESFQDAYFGRLEARHRSMPEGDDLLTAGWSSEWMDALDGCLQAFTPEAHRQASQTVQALRARGVPLVERWAERFALEKQVRQRLRVWAEQVKPMEQGFDWNDLAQQIPPVSWATSSLMTKVLHTLLAKQPAASARTLALYFLQGYHAHRHEFPWSAWQAREAAFGRTSYSSSEPILDWWLKATVHYARMNHYAAMQEQYQALCPLIRPNDVEFDLMDRTAQATHVLALLRGDLSMHAWIDRNGHKDSIDVMDFLQAVSDSVSFWQALMPSRAEFMLLLGTQAWIENVSDKALWNQRWTRETTAGTETIPVKINGWMSWELRRTLIQHLCTRFPGASLTATQHRLNRVTRTPYEWTGKEHSTFDLWVKLVNQALQELSGSDTHMFALMNAVETVATHLPGLLSVFDESQALMILDLTRSTIADALWQWPIDVQQKIKTFCSTSISTTVCTLLLSTWLERSPKPPKNDAAGYEMPLNCMPTWPSSKPKKITLKVRVLTKNPTDWEEFQSLHHGLNLVEAGPDQTWADTLNQEFPWMRHVTTRLLRRALIQFAYKWPMKWPNWALWGAPGVGKTAYWQRAMTLLGHPTTTVGLSGVNDSVIIKGTTAGWSTEKPGLAALVMAEHGCANPAVVLDEIDKAGGSSLNGRAMDALLPLLEPESARCYRDDCLQQSVDASRISWLLTLNDPDSLPLPLRSRLELIEVTGPDWSNPTHVEAVLRTSEAKILADWHSAWGDRVSVSLTPAQRQHLMAHRWENLRSLRQEVSKLMEENLYNMAIEKTLQ